MKDYYQIIGVSREATEVEIKRSFRKLAVRYHPDKNPSREAEQLFKEINEAYEVLSDPDKKSKYDQLLRAPDISTHWQEVYTRPAARYARPSDRTLFLQSMLRFSQLLFYFGCIWSGLLLIDFLLPARTWEETVVTDVKTISKVRPRERHDLLVTENGHHFPVLMSEMENFPHHSKLKIYTSSLFSALIKVENYNGSFVVNNLGTIYRNFSFAPIMLVACCLLGLIIRKGVEFHVNLGIVVFLLMILNIVFLYKSIL